MAFRIDDRHFALLASCGADAATRSHQMAKGMLAFLPQSEPFF
jgi:hypothetical protein